MATFKVREGTQVLHGGVLYASGEAAGEYLEAEPSDVAHEVAEGWLVPVPAAKKSRSRRKA